VWSLVLRPGCRPGGLRVRGGGPAITVVRMSGQDLLAALIEDLPATEAVEPLAFLEDRLLPEALAPVEPAAFALACVQAMWGARGLRN
jgi:hypothetical protein